MFFRSSRSDFLHAYLSSAKKKKKENTDLGDSLLCCFDIMYEA